MKIIKYIFPYIKTYWKEILLVSLLIGLWSKYQYDIEAINSANSVIQASLEKQLEDMKQAHKQELKDRNQALKEYKEREKIILDAYLSTKEELETEKDKNRQEYTNLFIEDRQKLKELLEKEYGFTYVETP